MLERLVAAEGLAASSAALIRAAVDLEALLGFPPEVLESLDFNRDPLRHALVRTLDALEAIVEALGVEGDSQIEGVREFVAKTRRRALTLD